MARRQFQTKDGVVSFQTSGKKKKGKKNPSAYNKFAGPRLKKLIASGMTAPKAMQQVGREWQKKKGASPTKKTTKKKAVGLQAILNSLGL